MRRQPFLRERTQRLGFSRSRQIAAQSPARTVDETSVKANMTRLHWRSAVGERLFGVAPFGRWQTQTFIAGLILTAASEA